jgi:Zn-finger nucleic acid-binding protein
MTTPHQPLPDQRLETRLPCPVCLGIMMEKAQLRGARGSLTLDHCERCGGIWFERGEIRQLASRSPAELWARIAPRADTPKPPCHTCGTPLDRDAEKCAACGHKNEIDCPACNQTMKRQTQDKYILDVCLRCHGVWFDHDELQAVWQVSIRDAAAKRRGRGADALAAGGDVLMEAMFWTPGLVVDGAVGAAHLGGAAIEVVGSAAEGVFSTILDFIGSLFDS